MSFALDVFSLAAIGAGAFFFFAGTVGLLRFPDSLTRLHALTKADNLGLGLVVLGLLPQAGQPARGAETDRHLGAGPTVRRRDVANDRPRALAVGEGGPNESSFRFSISGLALLVLGVRGLDHRRARGFRSRGRLCRLRAAAVAGRGCGSTRRMWR